MHGNVYRVSVAIAAVVALSACERTAGNDHPVPATAVTTTATTTVVPETTVTAATTEAPADHRLPSYGVLETSRRPVAAGETTCSPAPGAGKTAEVKAAEPGAPILTIAVPNGFTLGPGQGDVAAKLSGPAGLTGAVLITPTTLDAADAFQKYADDRTAGYDINSVSVLPAELCEYSGQKLMGMLAAKPGHGINYVDRIAHVWTNTGDFLVALQLQGPTGAPGLDEAASVMLADFGVRIT